ncbi:GTP cyclohydrolase 1 type 2/Nif3 [Mycotypha africana]|uniref:GTP cyclohydrolase 1 type 2/Nif3 n=1 Tax=Mycotypha africana TaxID=64632 RepID=UPI0022FFF2FB|nr:GTP cyclohydrolase 1 type 2/Nif3 [Mycotypha africana]KAI8984731.1 GTP cyclohydrolase 1 type 2/Nif3 [Mycotypha africana]
MSLLSKVARCMKKIAPLELAETSWDNVGVLVEPPYPCPKQNKVLLTIDLTPQVLNEALSDSKIGTIVSYHPPIFRAMKRLTSEDVKQDIVLKAIAKGVGIYSPHTACDNCVNGVNDWLASGLGKGSAQPITPAENPPAGQEESGSGRIFTFDEPTQLTTIVDRVKKLIGLPYIRLATNDKNQVVRTVAICAGSGSSVLNSVDADLYFTGEMGHHDVLAALAKNTSVILCEHSNTERGYLSAVLKPALEKALADEKSEEGEDSIEVLVSQVDKDPLEVV